MIAGGLQRRWLAWRTAAWWPAVVLVLVQTSNGLWLMPQLTFFPIYLQEEVGLAPVAIGAVVAGYQVAGMVAALLGGTLTGRLGSKGVLIWGLVLAGVSTLAFQIPMPWPVALLWFIGGAGLALVTVGGSSYLTRLSLAGSLGILAALYALSITVGGAIGNPLAGALIEWRGFTAFGWAETALIAGTALAASRFLVHLGDRAAEPGSWRSAWADLLPIARQRNVQFLIGLRCLPTIFYGMMVVLIPLLINNLSGSKAIVAAYGTSTLIVASAAQLAAGRAADRWGARGPTLVAYTLLIFAGLALATTAGTVWGLFSFGVLGISAAWSLSALMYVWVADGVAQAEHASSFGLLHAVWSLSMVAGSLLGGWLVRVTPGLPFALLGLLNVGAIFLALAYYGRVAKSS